MLMLVVQKQQGYKKPLYYIIMCYVFSCSLYVTILSDFILSVKSRRTRCNTVIARELLYPTMAVALIPCYYTKIVFVMLRFAFFSSFVLPALIHEEYFDLVHICYHPRECCSTERTLP